MCYVGEPTARFICNAAQCYELRLREYAATPGAHRERASHHGRTIRHLFPMQKDTLRIACSQLLQTKLLPTIYRKRFTLPRRGIRRNTGSTSLTYFQPQANYSPPISKQKAAIPNAAARLILGRVGDGGLGFDAGAVAAVRSAGDVVMGFLV